MKVTAAVLSVIFAGSYISCVVEEELNSYKEKSHAEVSDNPVVYDITETVSAEQTTAETTVNTTEAVTATTITTVTAVTSTTTTTTMETVVSETETVTTETSAEEVTTVVTTVPVTAAPVTEAPANNTYNYGAPVPESAAKDKTYYDKCAFIGDSHIKGMSGYALVSPERVFAQNGMSISHINDYISVDSVKASKAENVYIMMGTNGVMWINWDTMISQYEEFVQRVASEMPSSSIYIISIPPVTAERETRADVASGKYLNSDIDSYNNELLKMAEKNQWYFLDVNPSLKNESGCLRSSTDGVHMTKDLYDVFGEYILSHTVQ